MEIIKKKKILGLIGIIGLLIGTFLPYFKISFWGYNKTISLWGYWEGKIVLSLTLANALYIFKDFIKKYIPQLFENNIGRIIEKSNNPKLSLIPTILIAVFASYLLTNIEIDSSVTKYGLGFYVLWLGIIALIGHAIFYKGESDESSINNFSDNINQVNNSNTINDNSQQIDNKFLQTNSDLQQPNSNVNEKFDHINKDSI